MDRLRTQAEKLASSRYEPYYMYAMEIGYNFVGTEINQHQRSNPTDASRSKRGSCAGVGLLDSLESYDVH